MFCSCLAVSLPSRIVQLRGFDGFYAFDIQVAQTDHHSFFHGVYDAGFVSYFDDMRIGFFSPRLKGNRKL
jgi:hypothetical protein